MLSSDPQKLFPDRLKVSHILFDQNPDWVKHILQFIPKFKVIVGRTKIQMTLCRSLLGYEIPGAAHKSRQVLAFSRNLNCLLSWISLKAARDRNLHSKVTLKVWKLKLRCRNKISSNRFSLQLWLHLQGCNLSALRVFSSRIGLGPGSAEHQFCPSRTQNPCHCGKTPFIIPVFDD